MSDDVKFGNFDITEKTIDFISKNIKDMAGNPGQQVLVEKLIKQMSNGRTTVTAVSSPGKFDATTRMDLDFSSNHPDAIEQIISKAIDNAELFADQAEAPGPWSFNQALETGNWKVVGWDQ